MRVAVLEPSPRIAGVTKWAFELAPGFRELGHHCDVVSFTKSGRPAATRSLKDDGPRKGWRWWPDPPNVTGRWADAPDTLNSYDLVVLNEPKNNPLDEAAKKAGDWPLYVRALHDTRTPWVTAFHDKTAYRDRHAPYLLDCLAASSFSGIAIQCRHGAIASANASDLVKRTLDWPWLPYNLRCGTMSITSQRTIAMGGRMFSTKGYASLASVAHLIPPEYSVTLFGAESGGMGPCPSFVLFETLVKHHGWRGTRGDPNYDSPKRSAASIEMGNYGATNMVHPWQLEHPDTEHRIRYLGQFTDPIARWRECRIAAMLSTDRLVSTLEYTTLEALDGGCELIAPRYYITDMRDTPYSVNWLEQYSKGTRMSARTGISWHNEAEAKELIDVIWNTRNLEEKYRRYDVLVNREAIAQYHAPERLAAAILEELGR